MTQEALDRLRHLIVEELGRSQAPGCSVAVVSDGRVVIADGYGLRNVAARAPVTKDTLFPIASVTKCFTGGLCASLASDGILDLDQPVHQLRPGLCLSDPLTTTLLTLRDCLTHRSGMPRHDVAWYLPAKSETRNRLIAALAHLPASQPIRQQWQYNNLLYMLAGEVAGDQLGVSYEDAVTSRLLEPLAMTRTSFSVANLADDPDHARPYVVEEHGVREVSFAPNDVIGAAGCMLSTAADLAQWLHALVGVPTKGRRVLPPSAVAEMFTSAIPVPRVDSITGSRIGGYGLGLSIGDYRGLPCAEHGGNIDGFTTQLIVVPSRRVGVSVLCNANDNWLAEALAYMLLDAVLGLEALPHGRQAQARTDTFRQGARQASARREASFAPQPPVAPLPEYAADYRHAGYGSVSVLESAEALVLEYAGHTRRMQHIAQERFELTLPVGIHERRVPAQFVRDAHGEIDALALGLEPAIAPLRFERIREHPQLTCDTLDRLAGEYRLDRVPAVVTRGRGQTLVLRVEGTPPQVLTPAHGTTFNTGFDQVKFTESGQMLTPLGDFVRIEQGADFDEL